METQEIQRGKLLCSGRPWHVVVCARPDSKLNQGKHLIIEMVEQNQPKDLSEEELTELRLLTFSLAEEMAEKPGRWRVDFNGPAVCTSPHWHAHIKLPFGDDKLAQLVG